MTGPTSALRGEHQPAPGITWQTSIVRAEQHVAARSTKEQQ